MNTKFWMRFLVALVIVVSLGSIALAVVSSPAYCSTQSSALFCDDAELVNFSRWTSVDSGWGFRSNSSTDHWIYTTGPLTNAALTKSVPTTGFDTLQLSYSYKITKAVESADHVVLEWSSDGASWNTITDITDVSAPSTWTSVAFPLSVDASNQSGFQIRFRSTLNASSDEVAFDNIMLTGSAIATPTPTATPSDAPTPSDTPTPTPSDSPTSTPTPSDTISPTPTPSDTDTPTPTPSEDVTPDPTPTSETTPTPTPEVTATPTPVTGGGGGGGSIGTFLNTPTPTPTPLTSQTLTPVVSSLPTASPKATASPTATPKKSTPTPTPAVSTQTLAQASVSLVPTETPELSVSPSLSPTNNLSANISNGFPNILKWLIVLLLGLGLFWTIYLLWNRYFSP